MIDTILATTFAAPLLIVVFIGIVGILVFAYVVAILILSLGIGLYDVVYKWYKSNKIG